MENYREKEARQRYNQKECGTSTRAKWEGNRAGETRQTEKYIPNTRNEKNPKTRRDVATDSAGKKKKESKLNKSNNTYGMRKKRALWKKKCKPKIEHDWSVEQRHKKTAGEGSGRVGVGKKRDGWHGGEDLNKQREEEIKRKLAKS